MSFQARTIHGRVYQLFVPPAYSPDKSWPLVVYLPGIGENGTDGRKHLGAGLPPYVEKHAAEFPAFVLAPQCKGPWKFVGQDECVILDALVAAQREFSLDPARIYLTGLSQGGCSTFDLAREHPGLWAALVVVCGAGHRS